ncbi:Ferrous iron transport protein B [Desulfamplus magnetovallimortis]|uniref:Ferrous iron transport protein B n=2 Tax=Desulfamplus magnetovallimortis TaxID=1246637 RepID=A0A1W1HAW7_9BACT|nr:ferrous iron transport protein B [Desulfamplus magnetovallimortis]AGG16185.1 iron transport protein FeoB [Desulfamplus magnetovallimortis BW-1]SLM29535.1 Ferrous iron transport protein B [Desulfamplus magnetovallimortis]
MISSTIALAGNPNSGKTTLFNALTGARQQVGNYPGVTVEKKQGTFSLNGREFNVIDLPGTYSLSAYSLEEMVARDYLALEKPDMVVNIVDASNLERNLYLSLQFMEMGLPVCIALNMMDVADKRGISIDIEKLSSLLGVPVVPIVARNGKNGVKALLESFSGASPQLPPVSDRKQGADLLNPLVSISYGNDVDEALMEIEKIVVENRFLTDRYPARWIALKFLENDEQILKLALEYGHGTDNGCPCRDCEHRMLPCGVEQRESDLCRHPFFQKIDQILFTLTQHLEDTIESDPEAVIADHRYGYIRSILKQGVVSRNYNEERLQISDRMDMILTHRLMGPVIMGFIIYALYYFTFNYSERPVAWLDFLFGWLGGTVDTLLPDGQLKSLVISGVIDGVGGVLGFVPLIMYMFFFISILEDSGYLARVAFMLDRVFRVFGLHGSSVMPFILSGGIAGGCAVPGIMATRTLKSPRERMATLLTVPFMNCGAKLPVFMLLIAAFFEAHRAFFMFMVTFISWLGALLVAKFFRATIVRGESTPFIMELPPYRLPTVRGVLIHTFERTWQYIKKAGTVILGISVLLWAMMTFPGLPDEKADMFENQKREIIESSPDEDSLFFALDTLEKSRAQAILQHSFAGRAGKAMESVSEYAGFDWRINIALVGGFAAKEVIVSTLGTACSLGETDAEEPESLAKKLSETPGWRPLTAISLMIFTMFYAPCFVSVVCLSKEAGSWKWGVFTVVFNTLFAFMLAVLIYQAGSMMGF